MSVCLCVYVCVTERHAASVHSGRIKKQSRVCRAAAALRRTTAASSSQGDLFSLTVVFMVTPVMPWLHVKYNYFTIIIEAYCS